MPPSIPFPSSLDITKEAKQILRQPEGHEESSRGLASLTRISSPQVNGYSASDLQHRCLSSQSEKRQPSSPGGSNTQCHCWKAQVNSRPGCLALPAAGGGGGPGEELQWEENQRKLPGTGQGGGSRGLTEAHCFLIVSFAKLLRYIWAVYLLLHSMHISTMFNGFVSQCCKGECDGWKEH